MYGHRIFARAARHVTQGLYQSSDRLCMHNIAFKKSMVVFLDFGEIVQIVDHHPERLANAVFGQVAGPVNALQPRAVAEVKFSDRIAPGGR